MKDTGCRSREALQLKKKYFDLDNGTVLLPKNITKEKKRKRIQRITNETKKILKGVLNQLNDDDYLSTSNKGDIDVAYKTEYDAFDRIRTKANLTQKYDSGRFKKNMHSIRSFCYTQCKLATGVADYAHGYIGHDRYLAVYERLEEKEQVDLFNRGAPRLSIFDDVVIVSNDELKENYEKKLDKVTSRMLDLEKKLEKLSTNPKIHVKMMDLPNIEN